MAPLEVEGITLGDKHRNYNKLVKEAIASNKSLNVGDDLNTGENDIENLLKIDVACSKRDVDYIIKVLKCEDMLYVSRAIKQSKWLFTDRQYSHIINPSNLHSELLPQMTAKASAKLLLHVRLNLKGEARADEFYNHYKEKDIKTALRWLPYCSLSLIEQEIDRNPPEITEHLLKRLCERSITVLEKYIQKNEYSTRSPLKSAMFLINSEPERYLDITDKLVGYQIPSFGSKYTEKLMKVCPGRIKNKFEKYSGLVDTKTFAKYIKKEELKDFIKKQSENKEMNRWFNYNNLKHFVYYMPKEGRFEFLKTFFMEQNRPKDNDDIVPFREADDYTYCAKVVSMRCGGDCVPTTGSANIYRWYNFATFDVAFPDLIKLIRAESNPVERNAMFGVLVTTAGHNLQHVRTLLQYYHDKHINEPFKFKIQFVNMILTRTKTHNYDEATWNILNNIFHSMEVYTESDNNVQSCIEAIMVYRLLHDQPITEVIEKKFTFNSLQSVSKKLKTEEKEKVFNYLLKYILTKMEKINLRSEGEFLEAVSLMEDTESLLIDWKKDLTSCSWLHTKIKELIALRKKNSWKKSLDNLYWRNKSWRKQMFEESLVMAPSERTCYNALKHDPSLLSQHVNEVEELRADDKVSLRRLLKTLRVYWSQSLAADWTTAYTAKLDKIGGHKALTQGLCILMSQPKVIELVKKYAPTEYKINWSEEDELVLSVRKYLARNMHESRPHPPPDVVLLYAKGDYLQFAMPSLNAVLHNLSPERTREQIAQFLDAPVSLQKHGIRAAFRKLDSEKLKKIFLDIWMATKNASIRAVIFEQTFQLMCRETKPMLIEEIWGLVSTFINNLSGEENKVIYDTLGKVDDVPLIVKGKFFMKSYKCLKALPAKANCEGLVDNLEWKLREFLEHLDPDFVADIVLASLDKQFTTKRFNRTEALAAFLLCSKDENSQMERFNKVLLPALERAFALWDVKFEGGYSVSSNVTEVLSELSKNFQWFVLKLEMVFPTKMFTEILNHLEKRLAFESNYMTVTSWKLTTAFVKFLEEHKSGIKAINETTAPKDNSCYYDPSNEKVWNDLYRKALPKFSEACVSYLREDVEKYFTSILVLFSDALGTCFNFVHRLVLLDCLLYILQKDQSIYTYLMVLKSVPEHFNYEDEEKEIIKKIRDMIFSHTSTEVKFHYYRRYKRHDLADDPIF